MQWPTNGEKKMSKAKYVDPTQEDLKRPEFEAVWQCIKHWDISRMDDPSYQKFVGEGIQPQTMYAEAMGNDVMAILNALKPFLAKHISTGEESC